MWSFLERLLDSSTLSPHGICLLWEPELIRLHVLSDAVIATSYFSIPFALAILVSKRRDFQFGWVAWAFATFILACGLTHVFSIYTLWVPIYGIEGIVKAITAAASIVTAVMLWPLIPRILAIPTTEQLREAYVALEEEGKQRRASETLLQRFRETEATETQIRQAQKMEAIGQLTGGIAHDFNNILTVITGTIEILGEEVADHQDLAEIAKLIADAAARGAGLTRHLLAFARKQPLQPMDVDVNLLMLDAIELLKPTIGALVHIDFVPGREVSAALVDPNQLTTAVLNLALNARDAMPKGGNLTIKTGNIELSDEDVKTCDGLAAGGYVTISLSDTGHGIAKSDLQKVVEPFFTTKEVGKGTGLGLSMVYGFVKQSGGHIAIESEKGRGTTVWIYLPEAEGATIPVADSGISEIRKRRPRNNSGRRRRCAGARLRRRADPEPRLHHGFGEQRPASAVRAAQFRPGRSPLHRRDHAGFDERAGAFDRSLETEARAESVVHVGIHRKRDGPGRPARSGRPVARQALQQGGSGKDDPPGHEGRSVELFPESRGGIARCRAGAFACTSAASLQFRSRPIFIDLRLYGLNNRSNRRSR